MAPRVNVMAKQLKRRRASKGECRKEKSPEGEAIHNSLSICIYIGAEASTAPPAYFHVQSLPPLRLSYPGSSFCLFRPFLPTPFHFAKRETLKKKERESKS